MFCYAAVYNLCDELILFYPYLQKSTIDYMFFN